MREEDYFYLVFIVTLLVVRVGVYVWVWITMSYFHKPPVETMFYGVRIHHYVYGIILILIGAAFKNTTLYAIGVALFVDELAFILIGGENHEDNYSLISILGTILFAGLVFVFRKYFLIATSH